MSDERFEQDLRDAVRSMAPPGAPDSLRHRALAIPSSAPTRSLFAPWGIAASVAVAGVAAIAILVLALAPKPVGPTSSGSPNPSASFASETGEFVPISIAFWANGSGVAGGPGANGQGVVELTTDGGRSWTLSYLAPGPVTHVTAAGAADAWAIVDCRRKVREPCTPLAHTADGGRSWSVIEADEVTVSFADALRGWGLTSGAPSVVQTDDGGQNWASPSQPCQAPFTTPVTLSLDPPGNVWVVCTDGSTNLASVAILVMVSKNDGQSWEQRAARGGGFAVGTLPTQGFPTGLAVGPDGFAWMWGIGMDPLVSIDWGRGWTTLRMGLMPPRALISAWHRDSRHDLALFWDEAQRMTRLEETTDGGTTWVERFRWLLTPSASLPVVGVTPAPSPTPAPSAPTSTTYLTWSALPIPGTAAGVTGITASSVGFIAVGRTASPCCGGETAYDPNAHAWVWRYLSGAAWVLVPNQAAFALGEMRGVTASNQLIVAFGVRNLESGPEPATWTSEDGLTWQLHRQLHAFTTVTSSPFGFLGVTATENDPEVWLSANGATWRRVADSSALGQGTISALRNTSVGLVAVGFSSIDRTDPVAGRKAVSWRSANGITWERSPKQESLGIATMSDVGASGSVMEAVGWANLEGRPAAWRSSDGLHWERSADPALRAGYGAIRLVIGVPSGFLAIGASEDGAGNTIAAQWTSADGRTWAVVPRSEPGPAGDQPDISGWVATGNGPVLSVGSGGAALPGSWLATP